MILHSFTTNQPFRMKKIQLLPLLFAMITVAALQAQTTKGTVALGLHNFAPVGVSSTNALGLSILTTKIKVGDEELDEKLKTTAFGFSGSAHYFIIDNLSAGLNLSFQSLSSEIDGVDGSKDTETTLLAGPELRYYIPAGEKMKVFVNAGAGFGTYKEKRGDDESDPTNLTRFGGAAGLAFFPNQHVSIDLGLGYGAFIEKVEINNTTYQTNTGGVTLEVGFTVFL